MSSFVSGDEISWIQTTNITIPYKETPKHICLVATLKTFSNLLLVFYQFKTTLTFYFFLSIFTEFLKNKFSFCVQNNFFFLFYDKKICFNEFSRINFSVFYSVFVKFYQYVNINKLCC